MIDYNNSTLLLECINKNLKLKEIFKEEGIGKILYVHPNCILFTFQGEFPWYMKYITNSKKNREKAIQIFKRGFQRQEELQDIKGIQKIKSSNYYRSFPGLFGPFWYIPGWSLYEQRAILEPEKVLFAIKQGEKILYKIHNRKILHRDIKSANFIYEKEKLYLIDFGLAGNFNEHRQDQENKLFLGSPGFVPQNLQICRDFYGLGMTLADMLLPSIPYCNFSDQYVPTLTERLKQGYGKEYADYFNDLVNRNSPLIINEQRDKTDCSRNTF